MDTDIQHFLDGEVVLTRREPLRVKDRDTITPPSITALGGGWRVQSEEHRDTGQVDGLPGGRR